MKHTPGPWIVSKFDSGKRIWIDQVGDFGQVIKTVFDSDTTHAYPMSDADVRLIAAAPDLLAACKAAADYGQPDSGIYSQLRAAIAKAEGGGA